MLVSDNPNQSSDQNPLMASSFPQGKNQLLTEAYRSFGNFPVGSDGKESTRNAGDLGSIPGSGKSPGEGSGNPLQYSCMENPMNGGAW